MVGNDTFAGFIATGTGEGRLGTVATTAFTPRVKS